MNQFLRGFIADESAQDLVEYAYLSLFVGLAGLAVWISIVGALGTAYAGYDANTQAAWEPCDPGATPPCP